MNSYTLYDETRSFACANVSDTRVAFCVCIFLIFVFAISLSHIHNKYTLSPTPFAMNFKHTHQQKHRKKHVLVSSSSIKCGTQLKKKQLFAPRSHCTKNAYNSMYTAALEIAQNHTKTLSNTCIGGNVSLKNKTLCASHTHLYYKQHDIRLIPLAAAAAGSVLSPCLVYDSYNNIFYHK